MHPHQDVGLSGHLAVHQRHVLGVVHVVAVPDDLELPELGRQPRLGGPVDQSLGAEPVGHEIGHRHEREHVPLGKAVELLPPGHRAVLGQDLTDDAGGVEPRESREVHRRLGVTDPLQHPAVPGAEREDVARPPKVFRTARRIDGHVDRGGAVAGRDAGRHTETLVGINAHREGGAERLGVLFRHRRETKLVAPLAGECQADEAAPVGGHEVDHLGRDEFGRADEVTLVLAVLVVGHDDDLAVAQVVDGLLDGAEVHAGFSILQSAPGEERLARLLDDSDSMCGAPRASR